MAVLLVSSSTLSINAATNSSGEVGGGGGSGTPGKAHQMYIGGWGGNDRYASGLYWESFSGTKTLKSHFSYPNHLLTQVAVENATKGAFVTSSRADKTRGYMQWPTWFNNIKDFPGQTSAGHFPSKTPWDPYNKVGQQSLKGKLADPELVKAATDDGFTYHTAHQIYKHSSGKKFMDAVWTVGRKETSTSTVKTLVYGDITGGPSTKILLKSRKDETGKSLYDSPTKEIPYSDKSLVNESNHKRTINGEFITVTRTKTFMTDGSKEWDVKYTYSKSGVTKVKKEITYETSVPGNTQKYFRPLDLNRNGVANEADVKKDYPGYVNGSPAMKVKVDNMQKITNGDKVQTIDTNILTPFNVEIQNGQFGIPTYAQGGLDVHSTVPGQSFKKADGSYDSAVINNIGSGGTVNTAKFWASGWANKKNVASRVSRETAWNGQIMGSIGTNNASLTYGSEERIGGQNYIFNRDWKGGKFGFKTISIGTYNLMRPTNAQATQGKNWWEVTYEQGKFYEYGVEYKGKITLNGVGDPSISKQNFYTKLSSKGMIQPVLRGQFEAKTVGGTLGN